MKRAIYLRLMAIAFVAVLVCGCISAAMYAVYTENQTKAWLTRLALSAAENYAHDADVYTLSGAAGGVRVTVIAPDGTVLADSEAVAADMENHADREEVKFARAGGVYIALRRSSTLGERFMYASLVAQDGNIVRLAYSYAGLPHNLAAQTPAIVAAILLALILALLLAGRFTRAVTRPLERMVDTLSAHDYDALGRHSSPYYEIDKMMQTLQELLQQIGDSNTRLQGEREKVAYILQSMAEGFVLVDGQKNILLCNDSARAFFGVPGSVRLEGIYSLTRHHAVVSALQTAIEGGPSAAFDLELEGGVIVHVYVSPSGAAADERGATLLLVDITAQKRLEQQKRDFFSNASHELKTPITSIIGFSEMLGKGMVADEQAKAEVVGRIETEARRMSVMIADILAISKLESGGGQTEHTLFNMAEVVREAASGVLPSGHDAAVALHTDADDVLYRADRRQLYELCVNLIENAVKYNKPGGRVDVSLKVEGGDMVLTVRDTGIGIPEQYQTRVFERFFRVDAGRDKKVGGTGLGLSIVKHIVGLYGGRILLTSRKDEGTTVVVSLPM